MPRRLRRFARVLLVAVPSFIAGAVFMAYLAAEAPAAPPPEPEANAPAAAPEPAAPAGGGEAPAGEAPATP